MSSVRSRGASGPRSKTRSAAERLLRSPPPSPRDPLRRARRLRPGALHGRESCSVVLRPGLPPPGIARGARAPCCSGCRWHPELRAARFPPDPTAKGRPTSPCAPVGCTPWVLPPRRRRVAPVAPELRGTISCRRSTRRSSCSAPSRRFRHRLDPPHRHRPAERAGRRFPQPPAGRRRPQLLAGRPRHRDPRRWRASGSTIAMPPGTQRRRKTRRGKARRRTGARRVAIGPG